MLKWESGLPLYHLVALGGNEVYEEWFQIEKTPNGSFWIYQNGSMLGHTTDLDGAKDMAQSRQDEYDEATLARQGETP